MRLFHRTKIQDAESIWNEGFQDANVIEDDGCAGEKFVGVRLIDSPIGWNPTPDGNNLLIAIEIPAHVISRYEWGNERQHHWLTNSKTREFFVPATVVNYYGPPVVEEVDLLVGLLGEIDLLGV